MAKQIALTVPAISGMVRHRNDLLAEVDRLRRELGRMQDVLAERAAPPAVSILDAYSDAMPAAQNAFDIFQGEWSSKVPGFGTGTASLFSDHRIEWLEQQCGGFTGKRILELGPLEAGHTYMMASRGALHITSIEANTRAFLKCLIVKEALGIEADFILGDFRRYLMGCSARFDFVLASGVLYHMTEPIELLEDLARVTDSLGLWTHYFDLDVIAAKPHLQQKFDAAPQLRQFKGRTIAVHPQHYQAALSWKGFCGGSAPASCWMAKEDIVAVLTELGFVVEIGHEVADHPNGPCVLLFAKRADQ
jgi:uncharacterized protein DUF1698